jgi:probable O-glycosylation ligase (exosortase A-associated)
VLEKGLIITYLLTYGGAVVSLVNPFVGLLIYICFAIIKPEAMWHWSVPAGNYSRVIAIALLAGWAFNGSRSWNLGKAKWSMLALVGFWCWAALSGLQAPNSELAWAFLESLGKVVLPCIVGINMIQSLSQLKQLAWVIVLSQGYVAYEFNLSYFEGYNRLQSISFAGMDNNSIAIALVTGVGLAFFLGLSARVWWHKGLAFLAAALMAHAVFFSFSRGGMLALLLTGVMAVPLIRLDAKRIATLTIAVLLGLRMAGPEVQDRFMTIFAPAEQADESATSRLELWEDCLDAIGKRPIFGLGPSHWRLVAAEYGWAPGKEAHSLWLQIGAELGLPGLGFLLGYYLITVLRLWPVARGRLPVMDPWLQQAAAMVIAGAFGFMVSAQFVSLVGLELPYYAVLLGAGVLKMITVQAAAPAGNEAGIDLSPAEVASSQLEVVPNL